MAEFAESSFEKEVETYTLMKNRLAQSPYKNL